ncbi:ATP-binding protein [Actinomyces mediterranea]|uniref:ATP-binding protein n=1 Tax=Actinomyces mediterranea TaxID=1871028 RepID=UPI0009706A6C|nr:ATP-binding protein [Actinomyces mediterranea]
MSEALIRRNSADLAEEILSDTPVLSVSGARQVGKTTLVSQLIKNRPAHTVNLDDAATLAAAKSDPDAFVRQNPGGVLAIDEIQRAPELFRAIKGALEEDRRPGRFIITGSSNLSTLKGAEESLAGRAETLHLRGFSQGERHGFVEDFPRFAWNLDTESSGMEIPPLSRSDYFSLLASSSFPGIANVGERRQERWINAYTERVLSKDASELFGLQYPDRLSKLLSLIARSGTSEFVAAHAARELDLPERSLPSYMEALNSVFLIDILPAWGRNLRKRAISKPKVFAQDPGLAAVLAGVDSRALETQSLSPLSGGLMESFVATELLKQQTWSAKRFVLHHFRSSSGQEVDLVLEDRRQIVVGIEVKAAMSISQNDFKGLKFLREQLGDQFRAGILLHAGKQILPMGDRLWAMPISTLWSV